MDRYILLLSTLCFGVAIVHTVIGVRKGRFGPAAFNFFAIALGFALQTAFLSIRGHAVGRCPLTNLFEVLIFLGWSVALIYMLVGPTYRLSLMGAFTAPLVFILQVIALVTPIDVRRAPKLPPNSWLEFHASISIVAYGAFALAGIAGVMYLVQERQLKTRQFRSIFFHLPPLSDLFAALTRLLWFGFALYTIGILSGFLTGRPLPSIQILAAVAVWVLYAGILLSQFLRRLAPKRVATLCIVCFSVALTLLWGISFSAQTHSLP